MNRLFDWLYDPRAVLRSTDLLGDDQPLKPVPPVHRVRANAGLRLLVFLGTFLAFNACCSMAVFAYFVFGPNLGDPAAAGTSVSAFFLSSGSLFAALAELVSAIVAYLVMTCLMEGRGWPFELAWSRISGVFKGMLVTFVMISVTVGILALVGGYRIVGFDPGYSPWIDLLTMGFVAGIAEELIFRGVGFRILEDVLGSWAALGISTLIFGAIHLTNQDATLIGGLGIAIEALILPVLYLYTRSLWWTIGAHFAWNVTEGMIYGSIVSGTGRTPGWIQAQWLGPDWLTGGAFGIEGSVVLMAVAGAGSIALLILFARKAKLVSPSWVRRKALREQSAA